MTSSVKVPDLQHWQQCVGMCLICGHPLGLSDAGLRAAVMAGEDEVVDAPAEGESETAEDLMERLSLAEECPVRLCMMRFHMLGKREVLFIFNELTLPPLDFAHGFQ